MKKTQDAKVAYLYTSRNQFGTHCLTVGCMSLACPAGSLGSPGPAGDDGIAGNPGNPGGSGIDGGDVALTANPDLPCAICPAGPPGFIIYLLKVFGKSKLKIIYRSQRFSRGTRYCWTERTSGPTGSSEYQCCRWSSRTSWWSRKTRRKRKFRT